MKTYDEVFVSKVLSEMNGVTIIPDEYRGGVNGGVPMIFYESEGDLIGLFQKRTARSDAEIKEDAELTPEEYEFNFLSRLGLSDSNRTKRYYIRIKRRINYGNDRFNYHLRRFKDCDSNDDRTKVVRCTISEIQEILHRGCTCPSDYIFMRRFGLYA